MTWDELLPGRAFETGTRVVSAEDVALFAGLTGDRNPLHGEAAAASGSVFGEPVAHGLLVASLAAGLVSQAGVTAGSLIALVGMTWRFRAPVRFGDAIRVRLSVAGRREAGTADRGLVTFAVQVLNQRDEVVQEGELVELVRR